MARVTVVLALLAGVGVGPATAEPDAAAAEDFIRAGLSSVVGVLEQEALSDREKIARLRRLMRRDFDVEAIGAFALGRHARDLDGDTMTAYLNAFEDHIVDTYVSRLVRHVGPDRARLASEIISVGGTRPAGERDVFVRTSIDGGERGPLGVDWRVAESGGRLRIVDVYFLGISQALTYRDEFAAVIRRQGGVDGLIAALNNKAVRRSVRP